MKLFKRDIFSIIFIIAAITGFHLLGFFHLDSILSKLVKPIQHKIYFSIDDATDIFDKREQAGFVPKSGILMLSNFDSPEDLGKWRLANTRIEHSKDHTTSGNYCGAVTFIANQGNVAKIFLQYFPKRWENFESLDFDIYNPENIQFRIILQIKDRGGDRFKHNIHLKPVQWNKFSIAISKIAESINTKKITDLNFFRWKPKKDVTVFFDNIRLISPNLEQIVDTTEKPPSKKQVSGYSDDVKFQVKKEISTKSNNSFSFTLENLSRSATKAYPWTGTIQLPQKRLAEPINLCLKSPFGKNLPFQYLILNRWDDGSIKDIRIDFQPSIAPRKQKVYSLFWGTSVNNDVSEPPLTIKNLNDEIRINTGSLKFKISKTHFNLFDTVWLDSNSDNVFGKGEIITRDCDIIVSYKGTLFKSSLDYSSYSLKIVESGKMRAAILAKGSLKSAAGRSLCLFETTFNIFAGKNYVEINQNFIFPKPFPVESVLFLTPFPTEIDQIYSPNTGVQMNLPAMLFQSDVEKCEVRSGGRQLSFDKNLSDWVDVSNSSGGITVALSPNWNLPQKGYFVDKLKLATYLWTPNANTLDIKSTLESVMKQSDIVRIGGVSSSHDLLFYFHNEDMAQIKTKQVANSFLNPLLLK